MDSKARFKGLLARIFSNTEVDEAERAELLDFLSGGALTVDERREVVAAFVGTTWKAANADGKLSAGETTRLQSIATTLGLTKADVPSGWADVL